MARLTLRVPDDVYQRIQERAAASNRSINSQIVYDLTHAVDDEDQRRKAIEKEVDEYLWQQRQKSESMNHLLRSSSQ